MGSSCGACKFLRRRCTVECVFAPYFCYDQAALHFAAVHKVFGASNVSKLLLQLPVDSRRDAAISVSYQALARMQDPIHGCVAHIFALQQQVANLQEEIENQMAGLILGISCGKEPQSDKYVEQFPLQHNAMDICHHQNHSIVPSPSNAGHATGNQGFDDIYPEVQCPSTWEDLNAICNSVSNLETLLQGVELYGSIHEN